MIFKWLEKKADKSNWWQLLLILISMLIGAFILTTFFDVYDWIIGKIFELIGQ